MFAERLTKIGEERVFMLADDVYLSQRDVRELQFAKASIATGWSILLRELGVEVEDIQQVLLAGSFGAYLSPASAVKIGLVPRMALPRIVSAGNVASEGAKMAALSVRERAEARSISTRSSTSSCPAARTSTTCSSTSWRSRDERGRGLRRPRGRTSRRSPAGAGSTSRCARCPRCSTTGRRRSRRRCRSALGDDVVAVAYADCGTYGALDAVLGDVPRLAGAHCYDVLAGDEAQERSGGGARARTC